MDHQENHDAFEAWLYLGQTEYEPDDLNKREIEIARLAFIEGRAALQAQKPEPSDMMLSGVLRMPFDMAMATEISRVQFYHRAQQALNELEALQSQHETQLQVWRSTDSCGEFWSWDEADQYDYDRALPEIRRVILIIKEG